MHVDWGLGGALGARGTFLAGGIGTGGGPKFDGGAVGGGVSEAY